MCLTDAGICRLHYSSGRHWSLFVRVFTLHPPPPSNKFVSRDVQARPCPAQVDVRSITTLPTNKWLALYGPTEEKTAVLLDNDLWESQRRRSTTGASKEEFTRFSAAFYKDSPRSGPGRRRPPDGCGSASRSFFQKKKIRQETTGGLCQKKKSLGRWRYRRFTTCPVSHCVVYFNSVNTLRLLTCFNNFPSFKHFYSQSQDNNNKRIWINFFLLTKKKAVSYCPQANIPAGQWRRLHRRGPLRLRGKTIDEYRYEVEEEAGSSLGFLSAAGQPRPLVVHCSKVNSGR